MTAQTTIGDSPATLVAIAVATHRSGDREIERAARRELRERYGIRLIITLDAESRQGVRHAE